MGAVDLNGWYDYDDEGVKGQRVTVVDKGVLRRSSCRVPLSAASITPMGTAGGSRGLKWYRASRNLLVESANAVTEAALRQMLVGEIKKQNKPLRPLLPRHHRRFHHHRAHRVASIQGDSGDGVQGVCRRTAGRVGARRGHRGTPLASFAKILATSDKPEVFNGYCGAESGSVPVSAVSPAILVSEIEIEKKAKSQDRPRCSPSPPPWRARQAPSEAPAAGRRAAGSGHGMERPGARTRGPTRCSGPCTMRWSARARSRSPTSRRRISSNT